VSALGWKRVGCVSAGVLACLVVLRSLLYLGLRHDAAAATTIQQLFDLASVYSGASRALAVLTVVAGLAAAGALARVVAVCEVTPGWTYAFRWWAFASIAASIYAGWRLWPTSTGEQAAGYTFVAGNAVPTPEDVAATVSNASDHPMLHAGVFGVVLTCALSAGYVALVSGVRTAD